MRALAFVFALFLVMPAASAAPTCLDRHADTIRCGVPGAMPVGWTPPRQTLWDRELSPAPGPSVRELLGLFGGLCLFFALIALMPDFDGWREDQDEK